MSTTDAHRVEVLFADIADLPSEERRHAMENACAGDEDLRRELLSLLQAYEGATEYFEDIQRALPIRSLSALLDDNRTVDPYGLDIDQIVWVERAARRSEDVDSVA